MVNGMDGGCVLATHLIDRAWQAPYAFRENVRAFIEEGEYEAVIYISDPSYSESSYDWLVDAAPVTRVVQDQLGYEEAGQVASSFDTVRHIGGYWERCHHNTWDWLARWMYDDSYHTAHGTPRDDRPTATLRVTHPTACIVGRKEKKLLSAVMDGDTADHLERYARELERAAGGSGAASWDWERRDGSGEPVIAWTLRDVPQLADPDLPGTPLTRRQDEA